MAWFVYSTQSLNISQDSIWTSFYYEDRGDGTQDWVARIKAFDGNVVSLGAKADAAVTNPATAASVISVLKGILTGHGAVADAAVTNPASSGSIIALLKGVLSGINSVVTALGSTAAGLLKLEDAAHTSGDAGVQMLAVRQDTVGTGIGANGDYVFIQTDANGRVRVSDRNNEVDATNATSTALEATRVVKASAGKCYGIQGDVDAAGTIWIGDKATALNGTADNLLFPIRMTAAGPWSIDFGDRGRKFANGISVGFSSSSTAFVSGGSHMWMDAQYE